MGYRLTKMEEQKYAEKDSAECIELFCAKNRVQKHQIVEI